jgi:hypothetical protein
MPRTKPASVSASDLPSIATVAEISALIRVDERTLRAELAAGRVPGAFKVGRVHRVLTHVFLDSIARGSGTDTDERPDSARKL